MCDRGNELINKLKKIEDFSESLQLYFLKNRQYVLKKAYGALNHCFFLENLLLIQWFLNWVRSNPRGSMSQYQGFSED